MGLRIGRIRHGLSGSAVAAAAMAALTASQAPEMLDGDSAGPPEPRGSTAQEPAEPEADDQAGPPRELPYHTDLPPLDTAEPGTGGQGGGAATGPTEAGVPATVLDAYHRAEATLAGTTPGCRLDWRVLAAIGKVESGHARGGAVDADGTTPEPILGPVLNGDGFAEITDTDDGRWDSDTLFDRAVGPMQFIPSTWARWGADGNGDGVANPNNVYDATLAAGDYLCASGRDLSVSADLDRALLSYNHSWDYVRTVRSWLDYYREGAHAVPDGEGRLPSSPGPGQPGHQQGGSGERGGKPSPGASEGTGGDRERDRPTAPRPSPDDPSSPSDPSDPEPPGEPWEPVRPGGPGDPEQNAEPEEPAEPTQPGEPWQPVEPGGPGDPSEPEEPSQPEDPGEPTEPEECATEPEEPSGTAEESGTPEETEETEETEEPDPGPSPSGSATEEQETGTAGDGEATAEGTDGCQTPEEPAEGGEGEGEGEPTATETTDPARRTD